MAFGQGVVGRFAPIRQFSRDRERAVGSEPVPPQNPAGAAQTIVSRLQSIQQRNQAQPPQTNQAQGQVQPLLQRFNQRRG